MPAGTGPHLLSCFARGSSENTKMIRPPIVGHEDQQIEPARQADVVLAAHASPQSHGMMIAARSRCRTRPWSRMALRRRRPCCPVATSSADADQRTGRDSARIDEQHEAPIFLAPRAAAEIGVVGGDAGPEIAPQTGAGRCFRQRRSGRNGLAAPASGAGWHGYWLSRHPRRGWKKCRAPGRRCPWNSTSVPLLDRRRAPQILAREGVAVAVGSGDEAETLGSRRSGALPRACLSPQSGLPRVRGVAGLARLWANVRRWMCRGRLTCGAGHLPGSQKADEAAARRARRPQRRSRQPPSKLPSEARSSSLRLRPDAETDRKFGGGQRRSAPS